MMWRSFALLILMGSLYACATIPSTGIQSPTPSQHQLVVVDIDGTLTPEPMDVGKARPGAADALRAFAQKGYKVIYITARTPLFQSGLQDWLHQNHFPDGPLHVAQNSQERDDVAGFKARILETYAKAGWDLSYAYGDSSTDFEAYAKAGIHPTHVFALKRRGSPTCQCCIFNACLDGWETQLGYIGSQPKARRAY